MRVNTGWPSPHLVQKVSICDTNQQVQGRATTGEASEYLKKTLARDMLVMPYETTQSSEKMPLTFKITALWALKVPLEEVCRFGHHMPVRRVHTRCFLRRADNHRRHVSGRRLQARLLMDLLTMALESRSCHNMIPLSVTIRTHAVSSCGPGAALSTLVTTFSPSSILLVDVRNTALIRYAESNRSCDYLHVR